MCGQRDEIPQVGVVMDKIEQALGAIDKTGRYSIGMDLFEAVGDHAPLHKVNHAVGEHFRVNS